MVVVLKDWSSYRGGRLNRFDCNCFSTENHNDNTESWTSKGMSRKYFTPPSTSDKSFYPEVIQKQNSVSFLHENIVNLYITYKLDA